MIASGPGAGPPRSGGVRPPTPIARREHHVVTFQWAGGHVKLFRIQFRGRSLFINFPYHPAGVGVHARCTVGPGGAATIDVADEGRTPTAKIKYSHPIDGNCHFSQTGKIVTQIRNRGPRLDDGVAHLFTVDVQGLDRFDPLNVAKPSEGYVTFLDAETSPPTQLKVVGRWMPLPADEIRRYTNPITVDVPVPGGYRGTFVATAPPPSVPLDGHLLLLEAFAVQPLDVPVDFLLVFVGGFGAELADRTSASDFLYLQYPSPDVEGMESADFVRSALSAIPSTSSDDPAPPTS